MDGLVNTAITAEAKYSATILKSRKKVALVYTAMQPTAFCMLMT